MKREVRLTCLALVTAVIAGLFGCAHKPAYSEMDANKSSRNQNQNQTAEGQATAPVPAPAQPLGNRRGSNRTGDSGPVQEPLIRGSSERWNKGSALLSERCQD